MGDDATNDLGAAIRKKLEHEFENEACLGGCGTEYCRCSVSGFDEMRAALLAVLEVHKPERESAGPKVWHNCASCRDTGWNGPEVPWPCPTVCAIAAAICVETR